MEEAEGRRRRRDPLELGAAELEATELNAAELEAGGSLGGGRREDVPRREEGYLNLDRGASGGGAMGGWGTDMVTGEKR